ncbi:energy transducer TonB [Collimonas fungivorans]|uniref:Periplasmic binding protein TonB n=2 Tax=Collimonas fungivorans TaxID=158899 RepID=G0A9W0_COLFT|nr:energy transducer TonB [Collimonas fungivorans]ACF93794.1 TonB [Collimonas fungivorans Ter331]AEK62814.1 periplasmic binding protein TonB [Collimonas fungivorans Ter331]
MDFTQDGKNPSNNVVGISVVVVLHVLIVYALLTGLARKVVEVIQQPVETKIIEEFKPPPPPPPDKPVPPPPKSVAPPPPFVPPPEVKVTPPPQDNVIAAVTNVKPPSNDLPTSVAQPSATGEAGPAHTSAKIAGNCDKPEYPRSSLRNEEEGMVTVKLTIGADGNVLDSAVEKSSGFKDLDRATVKAWSLCHFTPAMADGKAVQSSTRMQYVWKLE